MEHQPETAAFWRHDAGPHVIEPTDDERAAFACAWEFVLGLTVEEIAASLQKSRATVYRALDLAERLGYLERRPRLVLPVGPGADRLLNSVSLRPLAESLITAFRGAFSDPTKAPHEVIVVRSVGPRGPGQRDLRDDAATRTRVSIAGARRLMQGILYHGVRSVGLSWGLSVGELAAALPAGISQRIPYNVAATMTVFSVAGSFLGADTTLAAAERMQLDSGNANALSAVARLNSFCVEDSDADEYTRDAPIARPVVLTQPLLIPGSISGTPARLGHLWALIGLDASIRRVFGQRWVHERIRDVRGTGPAKSSSPPDRPREAEATPSLLEGTHALVTAIGAFDQHLPVHEFGMMTTEERDEMIAAGGIAGLSSHVLRKSGTNAVRGDAIDEFNSRVITPRPADFAAVTHRARNAGQGIGTMLLARYPRAEAVVAAVDAGAVNILITDEYCAEELLALLA